jgi:hypothetical protein
LVAVHCTHGEPVENWAVKECDKKKKGELSKHRSSEEPSLCSPRIPKRA